MAENKIYVQKQKETSRTKAEIEKELDSAKKLLQQARDKREQSVKNRNEAQAQDKKVKALITSLEKELNFRKNVEKYDRAVNNEYRKETAEKETMLKKLYIQRQTLGEDIAKYGSEAKLAAKDIANKKYYVNRLNNELTLPFKEVKAQVKEDSQKGNRAKAVVRSKKISKNKSMDNSQTKTEQVKAAQTIKPVSLDGRGKTNFEETPSIYTKDTKLKLKPTITLVPHIKKNGKPSKRNFDIQLKDADGKIFTVTEKMANKVFKKELDNGVKDTYLWATYVQACKEGRVTPELLEEKFFKGQVNLGTENAETARDKTNKEFAKNLENAEMKNYEVHSGVPDPDKAKKADKKMPETTLEETTISKETNTQTSSLNVPDMTLEGTGGEGALGDFDPLKQPEMPDMTLEGTGGEGALGDFDPLKQPEMPDMTLEGTGGEGAFGDFDPLKQPEMPDKTREEPKNDKQSRRDRLKADLKNHKMSSGYDAFVADANKKHDAFVANANKKQEDFQAKKMEKEKEFALKATEYSGYQDYTSKVESLGLNNSQVLAKGTNKKSLDGLTYTIQSEFRQANNGFALMKNDEVRAVTITEGNLHFKIMDKDKVRDMTKTEAEQFMKDVRGKGDKSKDFNNKLFDNISKQKQAYDSRGGLITYASEKTVNKTSVDVKQQQRGNSNGM